MIAKSRTWVIWICPIITYGLETQKNPDPRSAISLAIDEAAAFTEGSSIAMGTRKILPLISKPLPRGKGIIQIQFSIMLSASSIDNLPCCSIFVSRLGSILLNFSTL